MLSSYAVHSQSLILYVYTFLPGESSRCVNQAWISHGKAAVGVCSHAAGVRCSINEQQQAVKLRGWSVKGVGIVMGQSSAAAGSGIGAVENVIKSPCS